MLLHHDNITFSERVRAWQKDPANRNKSVAGDDRSPAWTWIGCLYVDAGLVVMPADNLMTMLREGAKRVPSGKRGSLKSQSQSSLLINEVAWPIIINRKPIEFDSIDKLVKCEDFAEHEAMAKKLGFELFVKRANINGKKHVRVRPRFTNWSCGGTITVLDSDVISPTNLKDIVSQAGRFAGLGDWRPSSPKSPGPFGVFTSTVTEVK